MNLLYILSPSFSGSTLLTFMLDRHEQVHTFGELKATAMGPIDRYQCSCGEPIVACRFWQDLRERCAQRGTPFNLQNFGTHFTSDIAFRAKVMGAQVRGPVFETARRWLLKHVPGLRMEYYRILQQNKDVVAAVMNGHEDEWFLDGSKDPARLIYLARSGFWRIKVIKMCRDGRAQSNSYRKKSKVNLEEAAREWRSEIAQIERAKLVLPTSDVFELRYEDLCAEPKRRVEEIWNFLGLEPAYIDWDIPLHKEGSHILGNNNMRQSSAITISLDEAWRSELSESDLELFERIAGDTNRRLGYI